jgi:dCTP deaminase
MLCLVHQFSLLTLENKKMSILADWEIAELCVGKERPMISDFRNEQVRRNDLSEKIISFGLSSFGYDLRIAPEFKIFTNVSSGIIDPKNFDPSSFVDVWGSECVIPPNSFALARSKENIIVPNDITGVVLGKSTYARCGVVCICTPLEAGWEGTVTLEFSNTTPLPVKLYANEGACQVLWFRGKAPCVSYADRNGKYQGQQGITLPRM